jgi:hypothetical protein
MGTDTILEGSGLTAQYITQPASWHVFTKNHLVAAVQKEDWANDDVDFESREAGALLLEHIGIVRAAFDDPEIIDEQSSSKEPESLPNADQGTSDAIAKEVLKLMDEVLTEAETYGPNKATIAALDELEALYKSLIG